MKIQDAMDLRKLMPALVLIAAVFFFEIRTGILIGTVSYVVIALFAISLSANARMMAAMGALFTVVIVSGFFLVSEKVMTSESILLNRTLAVIGIWLTVSFFIRYRKVSLSEKKLKDQLKTLFEYSTEGMMFLTAEGKVFMANQSAATMFGHELRDLPEVGIGRMIADGDTFFRRQSKSAEPENRRNKKFVSLTGIKNNGVTFPIEVRITPHSIDDESLFMIFINDVTDKVEKERLAAENLENIEKYNGTLELQVKARTKELETSLRNTGIINQELQQQINARQRVEKELIRSQEVYRQIARNFPDGVIGILDKERRFQFVDGEDVSALGLSQGTCLDDILAQDHIRDFNVVYTGQKVKIDVRIKSVDYALAAVPLNADVREHPEALVVIRNIVHRKRAEKDLVTSLDKERTLSMLKSRFITAASHQFRTPLTTILSSSSLLEKYNIAGPAEKRAVHITRIRNCVNSLNELLNDFLSLSEAEEGKITPMYSSLNVAEFFEQTILEERSRISSQHRIVLDCQASLPVVRQDKHILHRILSDIISNAVKYSPEDSLITVSAKLLDDELRFSVTDAGIGIPEDERMHIFNRFFRARNAVDIDGTGLGLSIVKKYVDLLGGRISFTSRENEGTTFFVSLPSHKEKDLQTT